MPQTQTVNQQVRATDTVNVRSSDSEVADKIGKAQQGDILTRTEEKNNGWSKVIYEGKEAYIKSDYLEVVSDNTDTAANVIVYVSSRFSTCSAATRTVNTFVIDAGLILA